MDNTFSLTLLTIGIVQVIIGLIEYVFPPKSRNQKGYRTKSALMSQQSWDFAQKYAAKLTVVFGLVSIVISYFGSRFFLSDLIGFIVAVTIAIVSGIIVYIKTENAIKDKF